MRRRVVACCSCQSRLAAQQPPRSSTPTFRSGTRLIVQTVTVKDKDGKPIEGLTANDFVVTEDGEPQDISFVEFQRLDDAGAPRRGAATPAPAAAPRAAPSAPASRPSTAAQIAAPPPATSRYRDRRLLVLYFDLTALPPADQMRALRRGAEVHRRRR